MKTLYMMRGLPASGKTTERKKMLANPILHPIVAVNKDEIRASLDIVPGDFARESEVKAQETAEITAALEAGLNLIVDNTHNTVRYRQRYEQLAQQYGYKFAVVDFSHVPVEECIRRDALRERPVGEQVI